jgi:hypothetical protein
LILKYCDSTDLVLLLVGVIASLAAAAIYPLMFLMYGEVANTLIDLEKFKKISNATNSSFPNLINMSNNSTIAKW